MLHPQTDSTATLRLAVAGAGLLLLLFLLTARSTLSDQPSTTPVDSRPLVAGAPAEVIVQPGESIQALVDAHPAGSTFVLAAGEHRLQAVHPKAGNTFAGRPGAVMSGARLLTGFVRESQAWAIGGQTEQGQVSGYCDAGYPACAFPEDLFVDDVLLRRVGTPAELATGRWFFDYAADKIVMFDDPRGHKVELSVLRYAFDSAADNVTITGLTIEKYATPAQFGALHAAGTHGWHIEGNELRWVHGAAIVLGEDCSVSKNDIHHNGQIGIRGGGSNCIIEGNTIAFNNTAGFDAGWEAGGAKFLETRNLTLRSNTVRFNNGHGLWTDTNNIDTLYEGNRVENNGGKGIFHEISYRATIRRNIVAGNGLGDDDWLWGGQIVIANSPDVEVYENEVTVAAAGGDGIAVVQDNRGLGHYGPHLTRNVSVHDNVIRHLGSVGQSGAGGSYRLSEILQTVDFDRNHYYVRSARAPMWEWGGTRTWMELQSQGQERNGEVVITPIAPAPPASPAGP